jgi:hypothetical protein
MTSPSRGRSAATCGGGELRRPIGKTTLGGYRLKARVWLLNPDRIVLGGGVAECGDLLFKPIWRTIKSRCEQTFWEKLEIVPARLGNDAGIIGAAALALESEFAAPRSATSECKQEKPRF